MIRKLKIRFVMVNMLILTLVLFSTLSGIYFLMYNSEIQTSEKIMDTLIENHNKNMPGNGPPYDKPPVRKEDLRQTADADMLRQSSLNSSGSVMLLSDDKINYWDGNSEIKSPEFFGPDFQYSIPAMPDPDQDQNSYWNPWNPQNYWNPWVKTDSNNQWTPGSHGGNVGGNSNEYPGFSYGDPSEWWGFGPYPDFFNGERPEWNFGQYPDMNNGNSNEWNNGEHSEWNNNFWKEYWDKYWENINQNSTEPENSSPAPETEIPAPEVTEAPSETQEDPAPQEDEQDEPEIIQNITEAPVTQPPQSEVSEPDPDQPSSETSVSERSEVSDKPDKNENKEREKEEPKPKYDGNLVRSHIFAQLGADKEILNISYQYFFQYDDTETEDQFDPKIRNVLNSIASGSSVTGKYDIDTVSYRYKLSRSSADNSYSLILLDRSIELSTLNRLLFVFIIIGCVGVIVVFIISIILANWAIKPIEVAWNRQKQFIADASHELKTPLTVIAANTDVVLSNPNDMIRDQERWLKYIKSETSRMSKLVNELLYIAKSDSNEIKMEMSEFDISNLMSSVCLTFEPIIFEAGRELISDISPRLKYYGDEDRIKQLITILLDNASKYSLVGSTISLSMFRTNQNRIKFCVSNKCEEMSEDNVSKLFDRFYRVDTSRNSGTGGNGLGLNIAQTIAEAHNGNVQVLYNCGMISFTVTL